MEYPEMEEVETASHEDLARWYRFLPCPGGTELSNFSTRRPGVGAIITREKRVMEKIITRLNNMGGITPAISKKIGWERIA